MQAPVIAEFLGHLLRASWQASVLAVVVWLVIKGLGEHLNARWRCRLWMLVIVRLAWPVSLPSPVSLFNLVTVPGILDAPGSPMDWGVAQPVVMTQFLENAWVQGLWWLVVGLLVLRTLLGVVWAMWVEWTARPMDSWETWWILQTCKVDSRCDVPLAILESRRVDAPCVLGVFRPRLILPVGILAELDCNELRLVFLHELAHLSRRDLALNWLLAAVETIHWFNPLAWFVTRQLRMDREEDCDARALESQPEAGRAYGEVILKLIDRVGSPESVPEAPGMGSSILGGENAAIEPLIHRIHAIRRYRPGARTGLVGFCSWLAVALIGLTDAEPRNWSDLAGDPREPESAEIQEV
ncbi:MAG: M56 family metallopeptidase [Verrucomicrobiales bacterium]|nr:M56 family metallopeptidase [Verrucomicrobiales bacterium]